MQGCSGVFSQNISPLRHNIFITASFMPASDRLKKCYHVNITIKSTSVFLPLLAWSYVSRDVSVLGELEDRSWRVIEGTEEDLSIKYSKKHPQA